MLPWRDYPTVPVLICLFWLYLISFSSYVQHKKRKTEKAYQLVKLNVLMATAGVATARVVMLNVAWKRLPRKLARFVLFCPFKSVLFILLWVLGLFFFFRTLAVNSVSDFFGEHRRCMAKNEHRSTATVGALYKHVAEPQAQDCLMLFICLAVCLLLEQTDSIGESCACGAMTAQLMQPSDRMPCCCDTQ